MTRRVQALRSVINKTLERATGYRLVSASRLGAPRARTIEGGLVEEFSPTRVSGWVVTPVAAEPIRVGLRVNGFEVAATWATDGQRDGRTERRTFDFALKDIWTYTRVDDQLQILAGSIALPISGHGMWLSPPANGARDVSALRTLLGRGHVFGGTGRLQLSKRLDTAWQASVLALYDQVRAVLDELYGYDVFLMYGTLLGAVREGGVIGHDVDFDCAYLSSRPGGEAAAAELREIAFQLIDRGFVVEGMRSAIHIHDPKEPQIRIDLFHLYFDDTGLLQFPFGVAGTTEIAAADWQGTREIAFCGSTALIPVNAEQVVEHVYGAGWRSPKPGFNWPRDRTKRGSAGVLPASFGQEVYWSTFYTRNELSGGSPFFESLIARSDLPQTVLDIGCGDGRDALAFAAAGRTVLGLDRSPVAVHHADDRAARMALDGRARFAICDVMDRDAFRAHVVSLREGRQGPLLHYLRFFLHSIPEDVQESLLGSIHESSQPGDMLAAEFRTEQDEALQKVFPKHYRRYQNGPAFGMALSERFGFDVLEEVEGQGLSPFQDEDPHLYRVIARRP
jgi:hypothetical protein